MDCRKQRFTYFVIVMAFLLSCLGQDARALPFNDDMVHDQPETNDIMRELPAGSVPVGSLGVFPESKEAALDTENPIQDAPASAMNGERLWSSSCAPCHGLFTAQGYAPGMVNQFMPGPDVSADNIRVYASSHERGGQEKPDGHYFSYVHFGGLLMPRFGWKFSLVEHWDLVNYIRQVQRDYGNRK